VSSHGNAAAPPGLGNGGPGAGGQRAYRKRMGVLQLLDELPEAITRPPSPLWSVLARSLGEQGGAGRTALAWRWALTGACPSPVSLTLAAGRPPDRAELLAEARGAAELARPDADPGDQVIQARLVLEWLAGALDAAPLRNPAPSGLSLTGGAAAGGPAFEGAPFARGPAEIAAARSWARLGRHRYSRGDGPPAGSGRQAFAWALGALELLAWTAGEGRPAAGPPTLHQVALEVGQAMTGIRLAREDRDLARARRVEAVMETFLWLAGWNPLPPVDRHGHGTFEDCPARAAACGCDSAGQCLGPGCPACARDRCVHGFTADELSSPLAG
jgi:hypothetical protein